ncbi:MAG: YitT family protein, partial [Pygmaiobacter sp.]
MKVKTILTELLYDIVGNLLFAVGIYTFAKGGGFATGGFSGLGLIINHLTNLPIGAITFALNIPVIFLSYKMLGRQFLLRSLRTMVIQTLLLDGVMPLFPMYPGNTLLAAIFCGVSTGAGLVLIYMQGSSTGGTDFLVLSVRKLLPHLSIGQLNLVIDGLILLLGGIVYQNIDAMLYGLISAYACTQVIDRVMYGVGSGKLAFV